MTRPGYRAGVQSLRKQKAEAKRLGFSVSAVNRTGEVMFTCLRNCHSPTRVNNHNRKDGSMTVENALRDHRGTAERNLSNDHRPT